MEAANLNDLPTEILIHILSFIPTLDAIRTSVVSRRWRPLWSCLPSLHFPYDLFPLNNDSEPLPLTSHRFAVLVDRALLLRSISPIQSLRLSFIFFHHYTSHVDSWIRCALTRFHARELHLDFYIDRLYHVRDADDDAAAPPQPEMYEFRFSVLRGSSVERLSLTRVDLVLPASMTTAGFSSIRSLFLDSVELTDKMWEVLVSGCPNLEDLELRNGLMEENMRICSQSIKKLAFGYFYDSDDRNSLEIDCPNLVSLSFDCVSFTHFRLKNASKLVEFNLSIVHHYEKYYDLWSRNVKLLALVPNVKRLSLQNWCFQLLRSNDSFPKNFMLRNIRLLELRTGYTQHDLLGMAALLGLCPNVDTLILDSLLKIQVDESLPEEISSKPVNLNIPRLKEVKMLKFFGSEDENDFVSLLKKHGVVLQKITLFPFKIEGDSCHQYPPIEICKKPHEYEAAGSSS